ncbi:MAG: D-Ala-D-Ala carboxypeptidase family metallohydrolase [Candidatus Paceibacterota bacterium]
MITKDELLAGRDETFKDEYTQQISDNLDVLLQKINVIRSAYGKPMKVTSGWRPASINGMIKGAAPKSNHITGHAVDIFDSSGALWNWCLQNLDLLKATGLYLEDRRWTPTWVHFQTIRPSSKKRIFIPSSALPLAPNAWEGKYNSTYDG